MHTNGLIKLVCGYREDFTGGSDVKMKPKGRSKRVRGKGGVRRVFRVD